MNPRRGFKSLLMPGSHATSICNLARLDDAVVAEYAERIAAAGDQFPPLIVFSDGHGFLLVDGYLRGRSCTAITACDAAL